jgi:N-acetylglucosaminyldiphosphoundecaprenol N-acetyl-beta-D-mannosaminyltransferase
MKTDVLGVEFDDLTLKEAVREAVRLLEEPGTAYVVTPNPEIVWMCRSDKNLQDAVSGRSLFSRMGSASCTAQRF